MKRTKELLKQEFYSSCYETDQFKSFHRTFKRDLTAFLKNVCNCTDIQFNKMHFESSVWFTDAEGQCWNLHLNDVRWFKDFMFRKVKDYKDYHGETNINCDIDNLQDYLKKYVAKQKIYSAVA